MRSAIVSLVQCAPGAAVISQARTQAPVSQSGAPALGPERRRHTTAVPYAVPASGSRA